MILIVLGACFFTHPSVQAQSPQKRIEIDLTSQKLSAFDGQTQIYSFVISSGKSPYFTPTGTFYTNGGRMPLYEEMIGGDRLLGTYYDLPNVPYVMYFYYGYAIH